MPANEGIDCTIAPSLQVLAGDPFNSSPDDTDLMGPQV